MELCAKIFLFFGYRAHREDIAFPNFCLPLKNFRSDYAPVYHWASKLTVVVHIDLMNDGPA